MPNYYVLLLGLSKRVHSIYMLRLFNDPIAMCLFYASLVLFFSNNLVARRMNPVLYSCALSIKMNILLFFPALGILWVKAFGISRTIGFGVTVFACQVLLGLPFLFEDAPSYLSRSFDFGRKFLYQWTVNWKFVSPELFLTREFAISLLLCHIATLLLFAHSVWLRSDGGLVRFIAKALTVTRSRQSKVANLSIPGLINRVLFFPDADVPS